MDKKIDQKFDILKSSKEVDNLVDQLMKRMGDAEDKIARVDDEIREFFDKPMDPKLAANVQLNDSMISMKQGTESGRFSVGDIYELKNRFNRLQYDCKL